MNYNFFVNPFSFDDYQCYYNANSICSSFDLRGMVSKPCVYVYMYIALTYKDYFANCRCIAIEPGYKGHISVIVQAIDLKFAKKVHRTMHKRNMVLTRKMFWLTFVPFRSLLYITCVYVQYITLSLRI